MSKFFRKSWYRAKKKAARKSAFGGTVASVEEVQKLNQKIEKHEEKELAEFEKDFDQQLKKL